MLRVLIMPAMAVGVIVWGVAPATAQDAIGKAFAETLFKEHEISQSVREHPDVSSLTKSRMNQILQARDVLTLFFARLKGGSAGNVTELLSPETVSRYKDLNGLRRERFGAETYLTYEIIDFRISDNETEVKFRYFLSENDRGEARIRQRAMTFRKTGGKWLIAEFDNFEFN